MHPRLQLVANGKLAAIQFGDAVTLCARGMFGSVYRAPRMY